MFFTFVKILFFYFNCEFLNNINKIDYFRTQKRTLGSWAWIAPAGVALSTLGLMKISQYYLKLLPLKSEKAGRFE